MTNKPFTFKRSLALAALLLPVSLTFISCENEPVPDQPGRHEMAQENSKLAVVQQLLTETNQPGFQITDIVYNPDNSLKSFKSEGVYTTNVAYAPNKVIYTTLSGGKKTSDIVYDLVNQLAVRKLETFYTSSGNIADFIVTDYYYQSGKLYKEAYRENDLPDGHLVYYYNDQNVSFQERYDADGDLINKVSYEYYLKLIDKSNHLSEFSLKMDARLFPRFSKNLVATKTLKKPAKNPVVTQFTYLLNNDGYPVSGDVTGPFPYNWVSTWQ